jgi:hypothetical protein
MSDNLTLWFHRVNDNNWNIQSYKKVVEIKEVDDLLYTYKKINNFTSGMFFLMKNSIKPVYEDENNINGGVFTFKVTKKVCKNFWFEISYLFMANLLVKNKNNNKFLTGMSISPKTNNCIIKIWTNKFKGLNVNIFRNNIENLYLEEAMFRKNK